MNRPEQLGKMALQGGYDIVIIGGGATGLGCAVDAASRGYKTLLLEKHDFAKGTSSRSTKLVHGGVRYLAQGNIRLVKEALLERGRLLRNAPHVCHKISLVVPFYHWWQKWFYGFGLWWYEMLSGNLSLGKTKLLSKTAAVKLLPNLSSQSLSGGVLYYDGQFDDTRLAINLAQTAVEHGATVVNYCSAQDFIKTNGKISALVAQDELNGQKFEIKAQVVINATGVFADQVLHKAENHSEQTIIPSQGIHLVVDKHFFEGKSGLMIPKTDDGRVLFVIPWHDKLILGTTDTLVDHIDTEPKALKEEIDFIVTHFNRYTNQPITYADIKSVFVGLRPLAKTATKSKTSVMPRDHHVATLPSGLVHVTGGKWTTYRNMAEHAINVAIQSGRLKKKRCKTKRLKIHGWAKSRTENGLSIYGADALQIRQLLKEQTGLSERLHPNYAYTKAEVIWMIQHEMAITIEDILARRTRMLFLDARAALQTAPLIADLLQLHPEERKKQLREFEELVKGYLV